MRSSAQKLKGIVVDKLTGQPVSGVMVTSHLSKIFTNAGGRFEIAVAVTNDTLKAAYLGYINYSKPVSAMIISVRIELETSTTALKEVRVSSRRDFKKDSLLNREAYYKQFNYTGPTVKDAFLGNSNRGPGEMISINPLILLAALTKKGTPQYKLHKKVLNDEKEEFIDRKFNRGIAGRITSLKGDALAEFLIKYRPDYKFIKKATDYQVASYIRDSCIKFKKEGMVTTNPFKSDTVVVLVR